MERDEKRQAHEKFNFTLPGDSRIKVSSDFDSGNLQSATLLAVREENQQMIVKMQFSPASEPFNPNFSTRPSTKTFFHFSVECEVPIIIHAVIRRMEILSIIEGSFDQYYQICVGFKNSAYQEPNYQKIKPDYINLFKVAEETYLEFKYHLQPNQLTFFSYHFPYSVEKLRLFLEEVHETVSAINKAHALHSHPQPFIYYKNQLLIQSLNHRPINLLTITQANSKIPDSEKAAEREPRISRSLFPYFDIEERPLKFGKPIVMLTCRVHPGETSASFGLEGFIRKLLDSSPESQFLRKSFVFLIVPMLNPDGVYNGTYRMDTLGHNLNRFYNGCAPHRHPSIFAVQALLHHHSEDIVAFFDIHSHPAIKGSFFYGNAFSNLLDQIESQLFAKLLSMNSESFIYQHCTFSEKNMNSKDINDILTKDGSARVCAFKKMPSAIHCYTLEMGYHGYAVKKQGPVSSTFKSEYRRKTKQFCQRDFLEEGAALAITIAQIYVENLKVESGQASGKDQDQINRNLLVSTQLSVNATNSIQLIREEVGKQVSEKEERFRIMDSGLSKKVKNCHKDIYAHFYQKLIRRFPGLEQNAKMYHLQQSKMAEDERKKMISQEFKPIHSLDLKDRKVKAPEIDISSVGYSAVYKSERERKRVEIENIVAGISRKKIKSSAPTSVQESKEAKDGMRMVKEKVNITPVEFMMPEAKKKVRREVSSSKPEANLNNLLNLHLESLPKIDKKKLKVMEDRSKALRGRRVSSSLNSQKIIEAQADLQFQKMTIENQMDEILDIEKRINKQLNEEQDQLEFKSQKPLLEVKKKRKTSHDEEYIAKMQVQLENVYDPAAKDDGMNQLKGNQMYKRMNSGRQKERENALKNYQTERVHKKALLKSNSRDEATRRRKAKGNMLPKLEGKTEKLRNRFDLELKMKEKYDREYLFED